MYVCVCFYTYTHMYIDRPLDQLYPHLRMFCPKPRSLKAL